jgi:hypothetical protein
VRAWGRSDGCGSAAPALLWDGDMNVALMLACLLAELPAATAATARRPAVAPSAPVVLPASPPVERVGWYGQPSAIIDAASIAALFGGVAVSGSQQSNGGLGGSLAVVGLVGSRSAAPART